MVFFVSRQHYFNQNLNAVEIAFPSIDYSSPDMLVANYAGEGEEYKDPRDAVEAALRIRDEWKKDSGEEIIVTAGSFNGMEGEEETDEDLRAWAEKQYASMPKCAVCGEIIDPDEHYINPDSEWNEEKFCSEQHAERAYFEAHEDDENAD